MLTISVWAKRHPLAAHLFIAFTHVVFLVLGIEGGLLLYAKGVHAPLSLFYLILFVFSWAYLAYPQTKPGPLGAIANYRRRKMLDGLLVFSMGLMWLLGGNMLPDKVRYFQAQSLNTESSLQVAQSMLPTVADGHSKPVSHLKLGVKIGAKWLSKRIEKRLSKYENSSDGELAGIIVLGVLLTLVLGFAALLGACALACNGNDLGAMLVALLGAGLIAGLWVLLVRWIRRVKVAG